jgi:hypothetical protein
VKASWITGPSAIGSEKGIPISMMFAPAASIAGRSFRVVERSGYPAGTKGMKAICFFCFNCAKVSAKERGTTAMIEREDSSCQR